MDTGFAMEHHPEPSQRPCPSLASVVRRETASETSDLSRSGPKVESESLTESECVSTGLANGCGEHDEPRLLISGCKCLDGCVQSSESLLGAGIPGDLNEDIIAICHSVRQAIDSCQAWIRRDIASISASEAATAGVACQNEVCRMRAAVLNRFQQDQQELLERIKQVFTILVNRCSAQTHEDDGLGDDDRRLSDSEREFAVVYDLTKGHTELHSRLLRLQQENGRLRRRVDYQRSARQGQEAPPGSEDEVDRPHRWTSPSHSPIVEAERRFETLGTASEPNKPATQQLEDESRLAAGPNKAPDGVEPPKALDGADPAEVYDGCLSLGGSSDSILSEGPMSGAQAPQRGFLAAGAPHKVEISDETIDWKHEAEHAQKMTRKMQKLVEQAERRLRQEQSTVEELRQDLEDVRAQEERRRGSAMLLFQPTNLYRELGDLTVSPRNVPASPVSGFGGLGGAQHESGSKREHSLLKEQCLAWRDVALFLAFIILQAWQAPGRIMYQNRHSLPLKMIDWDKWRPPARAEKPFQIKGLLRALRQVIMLLSVHAYLSCQRQRDIWMAANGQTRRYLIQRLHQEEVRWWPAPVVDLWMAWDKMCEVWALLAVQTTDIWASWALECWFWWQ